MTQVGVFRDEGRRLGHISHGELASLADINDRRKMQRRVQKKQEKMAKS